MGIPTCPSCPTPVPIGVITGPEGAAFTCAGCKRPLVWRQGLAAPPTAVIRGRDSRTAQLPVAPLPPPAPEPEIPTDLAVVPVPRRPTPPGGMALGVTGEVPIAKEHHAFVSAELVAVADDTPAPPKSAGLSKKKAALALAATLTVGVGVGWFLFGREKAPTATPAPAETPVLAAPEVEAPPRPTRPPETSAALAAALEQPEAEQPEPREKPAKKSPTRRAVQAPRTSRPGAQPPPERTLNKKPVVLEYDDGTASGDIDAEWQAAVEKARAHYQRGNKKLFAKDSGGAIADYIAAIEAYGGYAAAYRGLGLALAEQHEDAKAVTAFRTYLRSAPTAKDAALIKKVIEKLEHGE